MKKIILALTLPLALGACSSLKYTSGVELKAPSFDGDKVKEGDVVRYPEWYQTSSDKDDTIEAVASEYSKDFQFAVDKAMLSAKRELASEYSSYVSSMMKDFSQEIGATSDTVREIDRTTKLLVAQVNLIGVKRNHFEVRHEKDGYRAFVKLSYTAGDANKLLVEAIKRNNQLNAKANASKAFKEMEESIRSTTSQEGIPQ